MAALVWWVLTGFGLVGRAGMVVLCYHGIPPVQTNVFRRQMARIRGRAAAPDCLTDTRFRWGRRLRVCVTFDDAFRQLQSEALPVLEEYGIPCVIFVPTANLASAPRWSMPNDHPECEQTVMSQAELQAVAQRRGVMLGSHTATHKDLTLLPLEDLARELRESRATLVELTGGHIVDIAFPHGRYSREVLEASQREGYRRMFTLEPRVARAGQDVVGRFSMSPGAWPIEFMLTCAGAYVWLFPLRRFLGLLRSCLRVRSR